MAAITRLSAPAGALWRTTPHFTTPGMRRLHNHSFKIPTPFKPIEGKFTLIKRPPAPKKIKTESFFESLFGKKTLYHGGTKKGLGDQLEEGIVKDKGKFFFADEDPVVAARYALQALGLSLEPEDEAVVIEVESNQSKKANNFATEGTGVRCGLGNYGFLDPSEADIFIKAVYKPVIKQR